ncbi:SDR family NAD(P)-dependent oxidoreductase [Tautonia sociabilis]|uniref:SDR family NAD(P)-dependent oxidoreductase n=1 Tax=Tautonia sociabilis TaxID=2080755 RepID=A0A432MNY2_9BACT|nr:SDR family NAD(P)-dependent oxidoreductase [Tautonia sociabilis]RUL88816.1 SDR family NAD(P)-dependent oxidoreductase [Tautonia sociabilis]
MPRRRRESFQGARCLVTGASSGIGAAFARRLAAEGARVVVTGRSADRLEAEALALVEAGARPGDVVAVAADLTDPDDRRMLLDVSADRLGGALDLVVNAAGVGAYGRFESHDPAVLRQVFEINVFALAELCRGALPLLRKGDRPAVLNVGSIVARRGLPGRPEYSASKFAVAGLTESIRAEWAIDGIHVLLLNPGFTTTAFERNLLVHTAVYRTESQRSMSPDAVARAGLDALRRGRNEVTLTGRGRLLLAVNRYLPRLVDWGFGRWTRRLYADHASLSAAESRSASPS